MELKKIMVISVMLTILTIGAVSAADDNATSDELMIGNLDLESSADASDGILGNGSGDAFSDLAGIIGNATGGDVLELGRDYYNDDSVSSDGISISKSITIDGKGKYGGAVYSCNVDNVLFLIVDL